MVRPDNTDDQRCIGARGNMSLLHVSKSGISLALQVSYSHMSTFVCRVFRINHSILSGFTIIQPRIPGITMANYVSISSLLPQVHPFQKLIF